MTSQRWGFALWLSAQADAKPDNHRSHGKGKDKGGNSHSQKDSKGKISDQPGKGTDKSHKNEKNESFSPKTDSKTTKINRCINPCPCLRLRHEQRRLL